MEIVDKTQCMCDVSLTEPQRRSAFSMDLQQH